MLTARTQPRGRARLRPDLAASWRGIGYVFGQSREDIFGTGPDVNLLNNPGLSNSYLGYGRKFNGSNQYATAAPPVGVIDLAKPFTIIDAFVLEDLTTSRIYNYKDPTTTSNVMLMFGASQRLVFLHAPNSSSTTGKAFGNDVLEVGKPYCVVVTWDGASYAMYVNGVAQNGAATGSVSVSGATTTINLARRSDGSGYMTGQMALFAHIAGVVDNPAALSANPWQMFAGPEEDDDYLAVPQGGPGAISGTLSATLAPAVLASSASSALAASVSSSLQATSLSATGALAVQSSLAVQLAPAALSAAASLGLAPGNDGISASLSSQLASATLSASSKLALAGSLSKALAPATLSAQASVERAALAASLNAQLEAVSLSSSASAPVTTQLSAMLDSATLIARVRSFILDTLPAPSSRTIHVSAERRSYFVPADAITYGITPEPRTILA